MKDKLLFGTIGLLVGVVVMQWTMPNGYASYVSPNTGIIAAQGGMDISAFVEVLDQDGKIWRCDPQDGQACWAQEVNQTIPVTPSALKFWSKRWAVTIDNHVWIYDVYANPVGWHDCGAWPGGPVAANQTTFGKVKAMFQPKSGKP